MAAPMPPISRRCARDDTAPVSPSGVSARRQSEGARQIVPAFSTGCEVQADDGDEQVEGTRHGLIDNERAAETFLRFHVASLVSKHDAEIAASTSANGRCRLP